MHSFCFLDFHDLPRIPPIKKETESEVTSFQKGWQNVAAYLCSLQLAEADEILSTQDTETVNYWPLL